MRGQKLPPLPSKQVEKYLCKLDKKTRERIVNAILKIPEGDIRPYKSRKGCFRLQVGAYRVLFHWIGDGQIFLLLIDSRGQIYKRGV
jgi:mRNA interferase RelE/StbE